MSCPKPGQMTLVTWPSGFQIEGTVRPSGYYAGANAVAQGEATVEILSTPAPTPYEEAIDWVAEFIRLFNEEHPGATEVARVRGVSLTMWDLRAVMCDG
jgi:hypothetical protein